jgi:hypothetical protein
VVGGGSIKYPSILPFGKGRTKEGFVVGVRLNYHPFPLGPLEKGEVGYAFSKGGSGTGTRSRMIVGN